MSDEQQQPPRGLTPEERKQQRRRNLAIALALAVFVVVVFIVTILRLGASVAERSF
jgi:hypothetical protein